MQKITLFSVLASDIELISVRAEFRYNNNKTYSSERMFRVNNSYDGLLVRRN